MLTGPSTLRLKLAACAVVTALLAGLAVAPAAADPSHRLLPSEGASGKHGRTVGQTPDQVNHRDERAEKGRGRPVYPAQPGKPGRDGRDQARDDRDGQHDRDNRNFRKRPRHADSGRQNHRQDYKPRRPAHRPGPDYRSRYPTAPWRYRYQYVRPLPYPIVVVPYHVHRHPVVGYHPHGQNTGSCGPSTQRYAYTDGSHQAGGTIVGGVVGAAVGSQFGKGNGRLAAVGVGTLLGALIGNDIGRSADAADRAYTTGSVGHALETAPSCTTVTWENPQSGNYGSVTPTNTYEESPGRYCREFQQQIVVGGEVQDGYGTACRQPDGSWEIVAGQS